MGKGQGLLLLSVKLSLTALVDGFIALWYNHYTNFCFFVLSLTVVFYSLLFDSSSQAVFTVRSVFIV